MVSPMVSRGAPVKNAPDLGSLGEWLGVTARRLARAGIDSARLDARLLAAHALDWDQVKILSHPEYQPDAREMPRLDALVMRREGREPLAHITGGREFWGLDFTVSADTLVPRPDSETLIEAVLGATPDRDAKLRILDLGTGSGCLLLALLSELPNAEGVGVDVSEAALKIAETNARNLGLGARTAFRQSDWGESLDGLFDLIVCNPPYIAETELADLEPEVARFEPHLALLGGADGLGCYRALIPHFAGFLKKQGQAFFEIGSTQVEPVSALFGGFGFEIIAVHEDLARRPRVVEVKNFLKK